MCLVLRVWVALQLIPLTYCFQGALPRTLHELIGVKHGSSLCQVAGYAYSGGGQPIIRVDVSADDGATWTTAELRPIDARRYRCAKVSTVCQNQTPMAASLRLLRQATHEVLR